MPVKVLFLYSEIASYVLAALKALKDEHQAEIHLVRWPVNPEAPFQVKIPDGIQDYDKSSFSVEQLLELAKKVNPDIIFCPGWIDKDYIQVAKHFKGKVPIIGGMDNKWLGTPKQHIARLVGRFGPMKHFDGIFVAGPPQHEYASKLGFKESQIREGYYSADRSYFDDIYQKYKSQKAKSFPKRIVYAGRYYDFKGVIELWTAFKELFAEGYSDWELWCMGTGDINPDDHQHEAIKHLGFVQPSEMEPILKETGVFILASHFEPWAVVVHEFAAAGFPLLLSEDVGASSIFLKDGSNGFSFKSKSVNEIKSVLKKIMNSDDDALNEMSALSNKLSSQITPSKWAEAFISFMKV